MVPSKSRSGKKWNSSILSKTKLCRGDSSGPQIDPDALVPLERKPSNSHNSPENRSKRELEMGKVEEEIRVLREQLVCAERDRNRALDEVKDMRKVAQEVSYLKEVLYCTRQELNAKDSKIQCLKSDLVEKDAVIERLREAIQKNAEASEAQNRDLLCEQRRRIRELEEEVAKSMLSESKTLVSFEQQKQEIVELSKKIQLMEEESRSNEGTGLEEIERMKEEVAKATEAEEKSRKAMDVLALALKEVAEEATEAKETVNLKLGATVLELEQVKKENAELKERLTNIESTQKKILEDARKEMETERNAAERLRLEAEETLLTWNGKEMGFVSCIKTAEEERDNARRENGRLRDIMKQAISEANAAKAAANIAIDEISKLKDALADKEDALHFLSQENERLKSNKTSEKT